MSPRQALLLSSSNCHGYSMLEFAKEEICKFLTKNNVSELIFVPFAQNDYNGYTAKIKEAIEPWGFKVSGLHTYPDPANTVNSSKALFMGGGNTFLLLKRLYEKGLVSLIKKKVDEGALLYIGSSAGTNVATRSIHTTNDMPITYPPSFNAIGIIPFNINPHYLDHVESETHRGETRDQRISEYMEMEHAAPVLGLREGSILHIDGDKLVLKGVASAVLFRKVASLSVFYQKHFGECASELFNLIPPSPFHHQTTRCTGMRHRYMVDIPPIRAKRFESTFIIRTAKEWNTLPVCFSRNLQPGYLQVSCE